MKAQIKNKKHKSTFVGETIAFSVCNKPFKPLGIPSGRVKSCEGFPGMTLTNNYWHYVINGQIFSHKHMVHTSFSKFNMLNIQTTSSRHPNIISLKVGKLRQYMLHKVQSVLTQDHGVSIILKTCIPKNHRKCNMIKITKA
jgi:hypothetical protein